MVSFRFLTLGIVWTYFGHTFGRLWAVLGQTFNVYIKVGNNQKVLIRLSYPQTEEQITNPEVEYNDLYL